MDREQIEKAISHYEELLADKEHFERLRLQFTKGAVANRKRWLKLKIKQLKEDLKNADE